MSALLQGASAPAFVGHPGYRRMFAADALTLGLFLPLRFYQGDMRVLLGQARLVEEIDRLGFAAVWVRDVPLFDPRFGDAGQVFDPFTYLGYLAARTRRIALATGSAVLALRQPVDLAKAAASVDRLSGGRLVLGLASGDRPVEFPAYGLEHAQRGERFAQGLDYLRQLLHGCRHVASPLGTLDDAELLPRPPAGAIPLVVTGSAPARRMARGGRQPCRPGHPVRRQAGSGSHPGTGRGGAAVVPVPPGRAAGEHGLVADRFGQPSLSARVIEGAGRRRLPCGTTDRRESPYMQRQIFETEHNLFRDAFRAFLDKEVVPHQDAWEEAGVVDRAVWRKAGEMGFLLPWADEEYGGAGLKDFRYEQIMCEELARINEPGFMIPLHSALCGPYIAEYGSAEQKARLLPGIVRGETILAVAMTEPSAGSDLAGMRSTAVDKGDHWLLNGSKVFISNGLLADLVIVAAKTDPANKHAMGLFLVERGMQGFERGRNLKKLGMKSQDTAELFFNNVRVPKENLLGDAKGGFFYLMNMLAQERLTNACGAVAGAEAALQATIDYVKERQAFGRPVAHFQNTRFKLAEMRTQIDVAQVFTDRCVMDHNQKKLSPEVAAEAKLFTTELLGKVVDEGVQLHGGWGYMWEYPICRMYANARIQRIFAGTSEIMKEIISRGMKL